MKKIRKFLILVNLFILVIAFSEFYKLIEHDNDVAYKTDLTLDVIEDVVLSNDSVEPDSNYFMNDIHEESVESISDINEDKMKTEIIDGREYIGFLEIPSKDLKLPILFECTDENLEISPCRLVGDIYSNNLVIAGHNYLAHFSLIKWLEVGDLVKFTDIDNNLYSYQVIDYDVMSPSEVDRMITGDWDLTLFTCTTDRKNRKAIRCKLVEEE